MLLATHRRCSVEIAESVLLIDKYKQYFVEQVKYISEAPHPSKLIHKSTIKTQQAEDDDEDLLHCPNKNLEGNAKSALVRHPDTTYGSLAPRNNGQALSRDRTLSTRSNKSATLTDSSLAGHQVESNEKRPETPNCLSDLDADEKDTFEQSHETQISSDTKPDDGSDHVLVHFNGNTVASERGHRLKYFENKKIRYIWDEDEANFVRLRGLDKNVTLSQLQKMLGGLSKEEQWRRRQVYGENAIHVEVQSYLDILFSEVLGPFYIFQMFSCVVWFVDDYLYYGICIILMSIFSLISSSVQIRRSQEQLRDTVESVAKVKVCRGNDDFEEIRSSDLVPGDVVAIPTFNTVLQFDAILLNGNVIVNESMLTGESVPITKTPLALANQSKLHLDGYYDEKEHGKHTLFCGTTIMQTRYYGGVYVKALVIRVGYQTTKGELVRSIMFPKPVDFKFSSQIHKFIGLLACFALVGFAFSVTLKWHRGSSIKDIVISALDLITITVPPALPAAMTIGIIYAQSRLKNHKIFCISPRSINISGCIDCVCFDKTGTLTEDSLSFNEVVPRDEERNLFGKPFDEQVMQSKSRNVERQHGLLLNDDQDQYSPLMICLASCHSLTIIDQKIIGDPLDLQMFEATGWILEEPDVDDENKFDLLAPTVVRPPKSKRLAPPEQDNYGSSNEYGSSTDDSSDEQLDLANVSRAANRCRKDVGILRQFPFSSSLQRMSVITRQFSGSQYVVYTKGAPERIASLCDQSTVPADFNEVLHCYTRRGFRVLALAYRPLKVGLSYARMQRATRQEVEKELRFLGLLTLGNLLKPETESVIKTLNKAAVRCVMVTGDNMLTAVSVARECRMLAAQDRTILIQVERKSRKDLQPPSGGDKQQEPAPIRDSNQDAADQASQLDQRRPLVLDAQTVQLQLRQRAEPALPGQHGQLRQSSRSNRGGLARPQLVWQYISGEPESGQRDQQPELLEASPAHISLGPERPQTAAVQQQDSRLHLALTGETWDVVLKYYPELVSSVCVRGTVFARMAPNQKQQLVEHLQALGYYVGMCGDGANDSGALRAAHAGVSLSDTEASVAAPFTSMSANISCIPILISEGRAALVTAFGILKYMAMYSLTQFCSVLLLYSMYSNFNDFEFLFQDLFIIATLVATFGRTEPFAALDKKAPSASLLSAEQLASVGFQLILMLLFQVGALLFLWQRDWYVAHVEDYDHQLASHDNFTIFAISACQLVSLAIVFSKGKPYRKSILSNKLFAATIFIVVAMIVLVVLDMGKWPLTILTSADFDVPLEFRIFLILWGLTHLLAATLVDSVIVDEIIFKKRDKLLQLLGLRPYEPLFKTIDRRIQSSNWLQFMVKETSQ